MTDRFPELSATPAAIEVQHLTKSYGPRDLTFTVPRGAICGFLGPNGAGKTTTMRILMGLARSRSGTAAMLGVPAGSTHEIFKRVAFVPEIKELYPYARAEAMIRMTRGFALGMVVLAAMLAIMSAVITALPTAWAFLGILGVMALMIPNSYVVSAPARGDVPWLAVGGYVIALGAAMLFTLSYVRAREY